MLSRVLYRGGGTNLSLHQGFTLAEILITLGIVGVVAALILPVFSYKIFEKESVEKLKQTFSIIDNAVRAMQMDEGCEGASCFEIPAPQISPITDKLEKKFKYSDKYCRKMGENATAVSWLPKNGYNSAGDITNYSTLVVGYETTADKSDVCIYRLNNGATVSFSRMNAFSNSGVLNIVIDVNGKGKPNRVGKDVFPISANYYTVGISQYYHIHPWSTAKYFVGLCNISSNTCQPDEKSPAAYVLTNNKLPDLTKLGYPVFP